MDRWHSHLVGGRLDFLAAAVMADAGRELRVPLPRRPRHHGMLPPRLGPPQLDAQSGGREHSDLLRDVERLGKAAHLGFDASPPSFDQRSRRRYFIAALRRILVVPSALAVAGR